MSGKVVKRVKRMIAKFAYDAQNDGDVSIKVGETMYMQNTLSEAESSGWAIVVKNDDTEGSVPYSYLQVAPPPPPPSSSSSDEYKKPSKAESDNTNEIFKQKETEIRKNQTEKEAGIIDKKSERDKNPHSQIHFIKHPNKAGFAVDGLNVRFHGDGNSKTLFFDKAINEGIWKLSLIIEGHGGADFAMGVTRVKDVKNTMSTLIGSQAGTGVALRLNTFASTIGNNDGSTSERLVPKDDARALNGGCVSLEVDTKKHTMHIFNNGTQLNYYVTNIPSFVLFGFGSAGMHTVKFVALDDMRQQPSVDDSSLDDRVAIRWTD